MSYRLADLKRGVSTLVYHTAARISPRLNTQMRALSVSGRRLNLKQPGSFSEKISWLKLYRYADDPLVKQCADKLRVRDYVEQKGLGHLLIPLLDVFAGPEEIRWNELPEQFALKWNFGCGFNLLCRDKNQLDTSEAEARMSRWGKFPYWLENAEFQYRIPERRILCEQLLDMPDGRELLDYKFYCFHGKALAVLVIARPEEREKAAVLMTPDWTLLSDVPGRYKESLSPNAPACLGEMKQAAEILSEPFPFVRVDFYEHNGRPFFGEMTFTPAAGLFPSEAPLEGKHMGEYIRLDEI